MAHTAPGPLAVSLGDPAGIGPEVVAKCWDGRSEFGLPPFVAIGDPRSVRAVWDDALAAYANACAEAVSAPQVGRAFDAAIALRWKLAVDVAATLESGEPARRGSAPDEAPEQAMDELVALVDVLLDAARRALA